MNSELLNLIGNAPKVTLGEYIVRVERANSAGAYGAEDVRLNLLSSYLTVGQPETVSDWGLGSI